MIALEPAGRDAGPCGEGVELVHTLVAHEVAPTAASPPPARLVDQHGHRRRLARVEERLRAQWLAAVRDGRPPQVEPPRPTLVEDGLDRLLARYREPHRQYHTVAHLAATLSTAEDLLEQVEDVDAAAARLALFFHDAVYDPRAAAGANEHASAELAETMLAELRVGPSCVDAATRAIAATAGHRVPAGEDATTAVVVDADLAILAAEPARYEAYVTGVRAEYSHLDDRAWRIGRAAVLAAFLDRPAIFTTAPMYAHEARARANLAAELALLRPLG